MQNPLFICQAANSIFHSKTQIPKLLQSQNFKRFGVESSGDELEAPARNSSRAQGPEQRDDGRNQAFTGQTQIGIRQLYSG